MRSYITPKREAPKKSQLWVITLKIQPLLPPLTPYDKWDGEKWVTDTEAQHSAAVEAAEAQRQSLIDAAMASISLIQLKLQAGRKLTQAETTRLNAVLDYIDAVTATDTRTAPDVIWPELPEA
ncbi:tail fiber assembly protein [Escherichia coli]|nr:tail fiber assembly protein [Escherichia coli]